MNINTLLLILIPLLILFIYILYKCNFKKICVNCVNLICGAPKTGKSLLSVDLSIRDYKKRYYSWWFAHNIFKKNIEKPLFYTNTAISFGNLNGKKKHKLDNNIRTVELEHLLREKRFNYGSVVYIQESGLMADNQDFKNDKRNAQLSLFNKLFGHETKGGVLYYDTQSIADNHYSTKRVVSNYLFIQKKRYFYFFTLLYVRELINNDNGLNVFNEDVENTMRKYIVFRNVFKKYDRYYFSYLTDNLEHTSKKPDLYKGGLISFNPLYRDLSYVEKKTKGDKNG